MAGIDSTGFVPKTQEEIEADLQQAIRGVFGAGEQVDAESVWGQFIGIFSERLASAWQAIASVYSASFPDDADGVNLINVCALTGVAPNPATYSTCAVMLTGTTGTVIASGKIASVVGSALQFQLTAPSTLAAATAWVTATVYTAGNVRKHGGFVWKCKVGGTSGAGPVTDQVAEVGGTGVVWYKMGSGDGYAEVTLRAVLTGPKRAPANTLSVIDTPVSGWSAVRNLLDNEVTGTDVESDAKLRLRRETSLRALGSTNVEAVQAAVFELANVTDCFVFENNTDEIDGEGVGPHSIEAVVDGGLNSEIAQTIYATKAAGIGTSGSGSATVIDTSGFDQEIRFSRPDPLEIWVTVDVKVNPAAFPSNGAAQIKSAIAEWGDLNLRVGDEVVSSRLVPLVFGVPGVMECALPKIGEVSPPTVSTTIAVSNRERAEFDTSRIVVNVMNF